MGSFMQPKANPLQWLMYCRAAVANYRPFQALLKGTKPKVSMPQPLVILSPSKLYEKVLGYVPQWFLIIPFYTPCLLKRMVQLCCLQKEHLFVEAHPLGIVIDELRPVSGSASDTNRHAQLFLL